MLPVITFLSHESGELKEIVILRIYLTRLSICINFHWLPTPERTTFTLNLVKLKQSKQNNYFVRWNFCNLSCTIIIFWMKNTLLIPKNR